MTSATFTVNGLIDQFIHDEYNIRIMFQKQCGYRFLKVFPKSATFRDLYTSIIQMYNCPDLDFKLSVNDVVIGPLDDNVNEFLMQTRSRS